ncbi:MAG TPA: hypothetical protein VHT28_10585 [Silvibacterium sp.]|nr:hypothetical protein [Silvibacterium sp.]
MRSVFQGGSAAIFPRSGAVFGINRDSRGDQLIEHRIQIVHLKVQQGLSASAASVPCALCSVP